MRKPSDEFIRDMASLEDTYLASDDPIVQSGFTGGRDRWRAERMPILDAITAGGDFLDVGCANGYLLESLVNWARHEEITLVPHGLDLGSRLIEVARTRLPDHADSLHRGDVWTWNPPQTYDYVYAITHLAPPGLLGDLCRRIRGWVTPGGRLIIGDYGSRTRGIAAQDMGLVLKSLGFEVAGVAVGGDPVTAAFGWVDC